MAAGGVRHAIGEAEGEIERWLLQDGCGERPKPAVMPGTSGCDANDQIDCRGTDGGEPGGCAEQDRDEGGDR